MRLLLVCLLISLTISCDKSSVHGVDLIGDWKLTNQADPDIDSGIIYEFNRDNKLIIHDKKYSDTLAYKLLLNNSINIKYESTDDVYDIKTYTEDSIEIMGFSLTPIPEELNTLLKRSYD